MLLLITDSYKPNKGLEEIIINNNIIVIERNIEKEEQDWYSIRGPGDLQLIDREMTL